MSNKEQNLVKGNFNALKIPKKYYMIKKDEIFTDRPAYKFPEELVNNNSVDNGQLDQNRDNYNIWGKRAHRGKNLKNNSVERVRQQSNRMSKLSNMLGINIDSRRMDLYGSNSKTKRPIGGNTTDRYISIFGDQATN